MIDLEIPSLSCGHCVRAVTETLHQLDPQAEVQVDLPTKQVHVTTHAGRAEVVAALADAGYPPA
jgi:copper chaperone